MKIGKVVQGSLPAIFKYCEEIEPEEFARLQDPRYSKEIFDINYPFCRQVAKIGTTDRVRYWSREYMVHGIPVRVTSQWFNPPTSKSLPLFQRYLVGKGLPADFDSEKAIEGTPTTDRTIPAVRGRYKGNAIGNAQNALVRNILSRLGDEQFNALQWQAVVDAFGRACAYCGEEGDLVMDHVVSINKQTLGEHRLGNLVPSCRSCNSRKADKDFREFLANDPIRVTRIEAHMASQGYEPIENRAQLRAIIELAHQDVRDIADRYVAIINTVIAGKPERKD